MAQLTPQQLLDLTVAQHRAGRLEDAERGYRQLLTLAPNHPEMLNALGGLMLQTRRSKEGIELLERALAVNANEARYHCTMGFLRIDLGQAEEATEAFERALRLQPRNADAHFGLGLVHTRRQQREAAIGAYAAAVAFDPGHLDAWVNLGLLRVESGDDDGAIAAFHAVLQIAPNHVMANNNLGNLLRTHGKFDAAVDRYRRVLTKEPHRAEVHSNLVYTALFHPGYDATAIEHAQREWNRFHAAPLRAWRRPHANDRDPERRLRVGYVSPNFRDHVIGRNVLPLLREHDRERFEVVCFADVVSEDTITARFRALDVRWHNTARLDHAQFAEVVRRECIDVLVDLTLHLGHNRLPAFACKPAPVQVSFAGYPGSSGVETMDYRLTDRFLEPGTSFSNGERAVALTSFWCFEPIEEIPPMGPVPALEAGRITFGCLNGTMKVNDIGLTLWARVLRAVPNARLILLCGNEGWQARVRDQLRQHGIECDRVDFVARMSRTEYLKIHERLDIALDTFPYNGHTTTCEALWMGVPVISLVGESPVSRGGLSILSNIGLPDLAVHSGDEYVRAAAKLAHDLPRLANLRTSLRGMMKSSPLMNAPRFAREIEAAYRSMWRSWCAAPVA